MSPILFSEENACLEYIYDDGDKKCKRCHPWYFLDSHECERCMEGCYQCSDEDHCIKCDTHSYFLEKSTGKCKKDFTKKISNFSNFLLPILAILILLMLSIILIAAFCIIFQLRKKNKKKDERMGAFKRSMKKEQVYIEGPPIEVQFPDTDNLMLKYTSRDTQFTDLNTISNKSTDLNMKYPNVSNFSQSKATMPRTSIASSIMQASYPQMKINGEKGFDLEKYHNKFN